MNTELLVMAAGMGSRFGGLKQIAPIGPNGEIINKPFGCGISDISAFEGTDPQREFITQCAPFFKDLVYI